MFSTAHLTSGIAVGLALGLDGAPLGAFVFASVFTDWDYGFQILTGRNHRTLLSHSPLVVAAVLFPLGFWEPLAWYALAGSLLHFLLDIWEYGVRLNPFRARVYGFHLIRGIEHLAFTDYIRVYLADRRFVTAEIGLGLAAAGLIAWRLAA